MDLKGLTSKQAEESRKKHGDNSLTEIPADPLWKKILEGFKDPMIMILMVAFVVQLVLCFIGEAEWFEPVGVLIAILIANGVSSISESKQEGKASALKAEELAKETAKVIRDGKLVEIHVSEVVVGDIVFLQAGDKIPADGAVCEGAVHVDQAALNGETEEAEKTIGDDNYDVNDLLNKRYVYRGTVVCSGEAYVEIKVVGDGTLFGKLALEVQEDTRETPLQVKLGKLAKQISTFGYIGAICIVVGVLLKSVISGELPDSAIGWVRLVMDAVTVAVTVIVCAVPEGLPMLTSILLSFQSIRMTKDNVLVRKINGLETAGSLSLLFSDKTGTITEGKLSVVELALGDVKVLDKLEKAPKSMIEDVIVGIGVNNSSTASNGKVIGGNSTDRAMMSFLVNSKVEDRINKDNVKNFSPFDSNKKSSSVTVEIGGKEVTYIKGAAERIIERCTSYIDIDGNVKDFNTKKELTEYSDAQAGRSMRLLAVAKVDGSDDSGNNLTLVCVLSIRDNVRKEAADAIREVQNAGIQVVMVTGDRKETAAAIAKEAGLLTKPEHVVLTSPELAQMSDDEVKKIIPNLRVVARALPMDKSRLVRLAQELNYVVGMTGDGVNDSPALKKADVGFAMGSGTEVAKDAGDITIMDDNFSSIEKAILYGRTMFKSIRKFLIFQLTVNVAAVLTCFIGPLAGENVVLTVVQLLLINLAMDTLAAIAFGSEPALKEFMKEKPIPREASIISKEMLVQILISALYITFVCLGILFIPFIRDLFGDVDRTYLKSALFATFMMAITFNGFNARTNHINIFQNIGKNKSFLIVMASIFILQFVFVTFGGEFLSVEALSPMSWLICLGFAILVIPIDMVRKLIMNKKQ
ncbi:MAG: calcium-translocating P-type ATPase, PMCA-type [Ruminococcus flavefaciens]|nr:calcium-translocating P-type ATPase, PMCA-type [Ruminococcus flavefaciens]MCM1231070.1 calcium-translocating P-type ATPase, PMCA-type [Ruminococcus flavefaciens]